MGYCFECTHGMAVCPISFAISEIPLSILGMGFLSILSFARTAFLRTTSLARLCMPYGGLCFCGEIFERFFLSTSVTDPRRFQVFRSIRVRMLKTFGFQSCVSTGIAWLLPAQRMLRCAGIIFKGLLNTALGTDEGCGQVLQYAGITDIAIACSKAFIGTEGLHRFFKPTLTAR
jgi:hypothetical protein